MLTIILIIAGSFFALRWLVRVIRNKKGQKLVPVLWAGIFFLLAGVLNRPVDPASVSSFGVILPSLLAAIAFAGALGAQKGKQKPWFIGMTFFILMVAL